jgi:molecular chaperone GrpE
MTADRNTPTVEDQAPVTEGSPAPQAAVADETIIPSVASDAGRTPDSDAGSAPTDPDAPDSGATGGGLGSQGAPEPDAGSTPAPDAGSAGEPADGDTSEDHERKLAQDLEELAAKADKADEYLELAQRTRADFENYRKRAAREVAAAQDRGVAKLCRELLPAVDNLDRALHAAEGSVDGSGAGETLVSGIKLVHAEVIAALARVGVERFSPEGEPFDPQLHEAVAQQPVADATPGTVVEVYQRGYRLGDSVIRPARVVVAG